MKFTLFEKLAKISGIDLYLLIGAAVVATILIALLILSKREKESKKSRFEAIIASVILVVGFIVTNIAVMLIQSIDTLLIQSEGYGFEISDVFSYEFTPAQFSARLILSIAIAIGLSLLYLIFKSVANKKEIQTVKLNPVRTLMYGAIAISVAFILSYIKLFSMPLGGSITLVSMLPIMMYAIWAGPTYGFLAAFAYGILQIIQGAYIVHWAQFLLDYFLAFTALGIAAFFPKKAWVGILVAGFSRMLFSTIAGAVFFFDIFPPEGWTNAWAYSFTYNGSTIGVDTILCVIVYLIPPVKKALKRVHQQLLA